MFKTAIIISLLAPSFLLAQTSGDYLRGGMSYQDVLALYGPPKSKVFQETLRRQIWHYPRTDVVFRDGRVQVDSSRRESASAVHGAYKDVSPGATRSKSPSFFTRDRKPDPKKTAQVFKEIMQAIPSEPDAKGGGSGGAGSPPLINRPMTAPFPEDE